MAWFSGRVSLGNFPDLAGAVNKLQESVKNIEKNFDSALGLEEKLEKSESSDEASGLWASATDRKALFDPVMALMGHKSEEGTGESSGMQESSQHPPTVEKSFGDPGSPQHKSKVEEEERTEPETDRSLHSAAEQATAEDENEAACKVDKDAEHPETAGETNNVILYPDKAESELTLMPVIQPEPTGQDVETLESEVGHSENSESVQAKSGVIEVDEVESSMIVPHKSHNVVDRSESMDEQKTQVENTDKQKSQAVELSETIGPVQVEASSDSHAGGGTEPSGLHSASTEETESTGESSNYPLPTALPSDETSAMVSDLVSPENHAIVKAVEVDQQVNDYETDIKEQQLSSGLNISDSSDSMLELEKVKREMKMMETALQGAARQAQAKADDIAKLMNENEHLKAVIEDLKNMLADDKFKQTVNAHMNSDASVNHLLRFL